MPTEWQDKSIFGFLRESLVLQLTETFSLENVSVMRKIVLVCFTVYIFSVSEISSALVSVSPILNSASPTPLPTSKTEIVVYKTGIKGKECGYSKLHSIVRDLYGILHIYYSTMDKPTSVFEAISTDNGKTWIKLPWNSGRNPDLDAT